MNLLSEMNYMNFLSSKYNLPHNSITVSYLHIDAKKFYLVVNFFVASEHDSSNNYHPLSSHSSTTTSIFYTSSIILKE
jgi:hypothetical protein